MSVQSASGVVLGRRVVGEGDLLVTFFLKGVGMTSASARGAAGGRVRFGGGTEPLVWGAFTLYRSKNGKKYLQGADIADDMLRLRARADALFTAARWAKLLARHLVREDALGPHPSDGLLTNLYWSMKLLESGKVSPEAADWRFLWRWLKDWGLAPDLPEFLDCEPLELALLRQAAAAKTQDLLSSGKPDSPDAHKRLFSRAARRAEIFLREI